MLASQGVAAATLLLVGLAISAALAPGVPVTVRALLSAPLGLVLPGLAWMALLRPVGLDLATRLVLSVVCTLLLVMVTGLALNWTPEGLSTRAWTIALALLTAIPALIRIFLSRPPAGRTRLPARTLLLALPWVLAVVGVVQAHALATHSAAERRDHGFTQLWLVPGPGGCSGPLRVGVVSYERQAVDLRLAVLVDQQPIAEEAWPAVVPGQRIEAVVTTGQPSASVVEAQLSRADRPGAPYRWTRLDCGASTAGVEAPLP